MGNIFNKKFDKVYLITSPLTYKERLQNIQRIKNQINLQLIVSTHKDNIIKIDNVRQSDLSLNNSYYSIFIDAIINNYNTICTLEDDLFLTKGYSKLLKKYFKSIDENWDVLNLGYHVHGEYYINDKKTWSLKYDDESIIFHKIKKPEEIIGTHCMAFKSTIFKHIIEKLKSNTEPMDYFMYKNVYYDFNCYQLRKKLFYGSSYRDYEYDSKYFYKKFKSSID